VGRSTIRHEDDPDFATGLDLPQNRTSATERLIIRVWRKNERTRKQEVTIRTTRKYTIDRVENSSDSAAKSDHPVGPRSKWDASHGDPRRFNLSLVWLAA
jgi:hypothetical protein